MARPKRTDIWRGQVRMPQPIANWLKEQAEENFRSINAELVEVVLKAMKESKNAGHAA